MLRHGWLRLLIADEVGLGKTIEAGLILHELSERDDHFRALVVLPAGLRAQWAVELSRHFGMAAVEADATWLRQRTRELPGDVNPWSLPGVYLASFDLLKRPEVLRPLEDVLWDLLVVDEAHAASAGTDRRAAVNAVAVRSRRVILMSATPGWGDADAIRSLSAIGEIDGGPPLAVIRRSRADALGASARRTKLLPVRLTAAERRMHARLTRYASAVCAEAAARGDARARLAVIVLRKRALSSAASLHVSASRRLALLSEGPPPLLMQLPLPLDDEQLVEDAEPDAVLGARGLANATRERQLLHLVIDAAADAARHESKVRVLRRLLRRLREPAVVFTEYRDTLVRLRAALVEDLRPIFTLHGAMPASERHEAVRRFTSTDSILIATDAAAEGLNLHDGARVVVHFELPWNPARLEQRAGRVDRFGQMRRVHEAALVARHTSESLVLAPLGRRSRSGPPGAAGLFELLTESRIADAVLAGQRPRDTSAAAHALPSLLDLSGEALVEATRIEELRNHVALRRDTAHGDRTLVESSVRRKRSSLPPGAIHVYELQLTGAGGALLHSELVAVVDGRADARAWLSRMQALAESANAALRDREQRIVRPHESTSQALVQAGLFDRRALRSAADRQRTASVLIEESTRRRQNLFDDRLSSAAELRAILRVLA
jgi:superfamily II DNA or RNA helicase